jgi:hypothetical protein
MRRVLSSVLGLCVVFGVSSLCAATDPPTSKKDPIADAFMVKKGINLRSDQQADIAHLRTEYEPKLKAALDEKDAASSVKDKDIAARKFLHMRTEIHKKIEVILMKPDPNYKPPQHHKPPQHKKPQQPKRH